MVNGMLTHVHVHVQFNKFIHVAASPRIFGSLAERPCARTLPLLAAVVATSTPVLLARRCVDLLRVARAAAGGAQAADAPAGGRLRGAPEGAVTGRLVAGGWQAGAAALDLRA